MIEPLQIGIVVACLLLALATLWLVVRDERPNDPLALGLAVVEVALLVQLVAGIVLLTRSDGDVSGDLSGRHGKVLGPQGKMPSPKDSTAGSHRSRVRGPRSTGTRSASKA